MAVSADRGAADAEPASDAGVGGAGAARAYAWQGGDVVGGAVCASDVADADADTAALVVGGGGASRGGVGGRGRSPAVGAAPASPSVGAVGRAVDISEQRSGAGEWH